LLPQKQGERLIEEVRLLADLMMKMRYLFISITKNKLRFQELGETEKLPRNTVKIEPLGRSRLSTEFLEQLLPPGQFKNPTFTFDDSAARHAFVSFATAELAYKASEHIRNWIAENNETSDVRIRQQLVKESLEPQYSISEDELQKLPAVQPPENIIVVAEEDDVEEAMKTLLKGKSINKITEKDNLVIGFGVKWHGLSTFLRLERPKLCLVQLASDDTAVLFRIRKLGGIPSPVAELLGNKAVKKVGSGVVSDAKVLFSLYDVAVENVKDIHQTPAALRSEPNNFPGLAGIFLGQRIEEKTIRAMQLSNWQTSKDYTPAQVNFAASDAFYARELYLKLDNSPVDFKLDHKY